MIDLLKPPKNRLPSYSTLRRALLHIDEEQYSTCLAKFFDVQPKSGETIGLDGKVLRGSYQLEDDNPNSETLDGRQSWPGLKTVIRVESECQIIRHNHVEVKSETRYYISSLSATAKEFSDRIRGYWGVENKVHYVRDVTQQEDSSRIRCNTDTKKAILIS